MTDPLKKAAWQAQAENNPEAWEFAVRTLKSDMDPNDNDTHHALREASNALLNCPGLRRSAALILLEIAGELPAQEHRQAVRDQVHNYFELDGENKLGPERDLARTSAFGERAVQTPIPCAGPPR